MTSEVTALADQFRWKPSRWAERSLQLLLALLVSLVGVSLRPPPSAFAAGVVGTGTPESCTEAALDAALEGGGLVTFDCGAEPVTITMTAEKVITAEMGETIVDGSGLVTLSGGDAVRVFRVDEPGMLDVRNLTVAHGRGRGIDDGGGIYNSGTLTVTNSSFSENSAPGSGAGIANFGTLMVTNSTFSGNSGGDFGGGIANEFGGTLTVTNSTFSENTSGLGGGIYNQGTLTVTHSTFSANSAAAGGGIFNGNDGTLAVSNSIVASSTNGGDCVNSSVAITDGGHNLIEDAENSCGLADGVNGNLVGVDPMLDPEGLKDNGGPTQTIALLPGSPAIGAGDANVCANPPVNGIDQRGYIRPGAGAATCSIGAYEYNSAGPPSICVGDCDADGNVFINEIIILVNIALGNAEPATCPDGVPSGAEVNVTLITQAVSAALNGCPATAACGGIAGLLCPTGEVCDLRDPTCAVADLGGTCVVSTGLCTLEYVPVCGCDGVTYGNDCARVSAGATLAHTGACAAGS